MNKFIFIVLFFLTPFVSFSQLSENFSDGLFHGSNRSVEWAGDVNKFIVNESLQLQLNASGAESPALLRTSSTLSANAQWEWWIKLGFNTTASNYAKIFLCSDETDLNGDLNGLFVRIGYTDKNVCLMQSQKGKTNKTLIKGTVKRLDKDSVSLRLKATFDENGVFTLYSKLDDETDYVLEGNCNITESFESKAFGIACYFTSTRSKLFYFDDFSTRELEDGGTGTDQNPDSSKIVINEILYDPPTGGAEYVEIYNNSDKVFDLQFLSFTTRKPSDGSLNKLYPLAASETLFRPREYLVITKSRDLVCPFFNCHSESLFAELSVMPALANTSGCVVLLDNKTNKVIDEFAYNANMHTAGISNKKGISLERSDFNKSASDASNWHSASADSNFGTPGYQNSQMTTGQNVIDDISIIYPNFDTDSYFIHYRMDKPGYRCRAFVYDAMGRSVSIIANNELLGTEGKLLWNGKGNSNLSLAAGIYIIYVEVYNTDGDVKKFRKPVIVK